MTPTDPLDLNGKEQQLIQSALRLAETCDYEVDHVHQVTRLALRLFDDLQPWHQMSAVERLYLRVASILHDIGWVDGWRNHHKSSLNMILSTSMLPLNSKERLIVGSIARYHSRSLPKQSHDHYAALKPGEQRMVSILAGCLRLADGFDTTHLCRVHDLHCHLDQRRLRVTYFATSPLSDEEFGAMQKCDLLEDVTGARAEIIWQPLTAYVSTPA